MSHPTARTISPRRQILNTLQVSNPDALDDVNRSFWANRSHRFGAYEFRPETGEVLVEGEVVAQLTETEAETFNVLIRVYPLPVPRRRLVEEMRRLGCYWHIDTAKVVIARIRTKLGPGIIETHSRGYLFSPRFWVEN
jgi:DNA-binding response OmpR family regulator